MCKKENQTNRPQTTGFRFQSSLEKEFTPQSFNNSERETSQVLSSLLFKLPMLRNLKRKWKLRKTSEFIKIIVFCFVLLVSWRPLFISQNSVQSIGLAQLLRDQQQAVAAKQAHRQPLGDEQSHHQATAAKQACNKA